MRSSQTGRRLLALAGLTATIVISGSIAVADGPDARDIAADALATSPALVDETAAPSPTDLATEVEQARTIREPVVADRSVGIAVDPNATTMVASWYGPNFHGRLTANGEVYDQWGLTAAHKTLPFGTVLDVTNPATGRSVTVRINDRGPFIGGRDLDLSRGAADAIGLGGVGRMDVVIRD